MYNVKCGNGQYMVCELFTFLYKTISMSPYKYFYYNFEIISARTEYFSVDSIHKNISTRI